ncbi:hypothetical protein HPP92_008206 [Vanilla planifolia]|uniref:Uncharacterized protein n=1 Tax=Vanilla planifolia TaxID=51239 RepID=A0A835RBU8_VANPL|nr:hypothetical protein HPP92_008206 [Vanilla planifolia]
MPKTQAKTLLAFLALLLTISSISAQRLLLCGRYPGFCYANGSPDSNCCAGLCVVLHLDPLNCGRCGHRCLWEQACCRGRCVDLLTTRNDCGACGNKCSRELTCNYGMCNYA